MTLVLIEDEIPEEEQLSQYANPTVKCGWCGAIIRLDGSELALAMCQACYDGMLAEFLRSQQPKQGPNHTSDR
jgi:hypothetical protein